MNHSINLNTKWDHMEDEVDSLAQVLNEYNIDLLLVDSYQVTSEYFKNIHQHVKVIYLDDRNAFFYHVDGIINYCHYYKEFHYESVYPELVPVNVCGNEEDGYLNGDYWHHTPDENIRFWLGCKYIPLREEFQGNAKKTIVPEIRRVMITTGGSDPYRISEVITDEILKAELNWEIHLVAGRFYDNVEHLKKKYQCNNNVYIHQNQKMSVLMEMCDIAISAGGTTLYELCSLGVPTICFAFADNQCLGTKQMQKQGIMLNLGDYTKDHNEFVSNLRSSIKKIQSENFRKEISEKMLALVDGKGAQRIARVLMERAKDVSIT